MLTQYHSYSRVLGYASDLGNNLDIVLASGFNYSLTDHPRAAYIACEQGMTERGVSVLPRDSAVLQSGI